ncbi:MAG TPA: RDD family protein [Nocardioidaceae bacterium]|nr:RDD family protein [Nocardioidaceae bacterium]
MAGQAAEHTWPGRRYGLPEEGPGAVGGWGRRMVALFVDWFLSLLVVAALAGPQVWSGGGTAQWGPLLVFAVQRWVLIVLLGGSAAQLMLGLQVVRVTGGGLGPVRALARTALLCLVIPAAIYNNDRQGLHDLAADSIVVRR